MDSPESAGSSVQRLYLLCAVWHLLQLLGRIVSPVFALLASFHVLEHESFNRATAVPAHPPIPSLPLPLPLRFFTFSLCLRLLIFSSILIPYLFSFSSAFFPAPTSFFLSLAFSLALSLSLSLSPHSVFLHARFLSPESLSTTARRLIVPLFCPRERKEE